MQGRLTKLVTILAALSVLLTACQPALQQSGSTAESTTAQAATESETEVIPMGETIEAQITMEDGGVITLELYPEIAPITVENFVKLCEDNFYDGLTFHRIIPGFMIQGGDPDGNGTGGPGYGIKGEFSANGVANPLKHERGVISMARSRDMDSAGSQFFIMHDVAPHLDGQYAAFGRVTDGMDVVDAIAETATGIDGQTPIEPPVMETVRILHTQE